MAEAEHTPEQRQHVISELERIWQSSTEPIARRQKAKQAWEALTVSYRSYGDPSRLVGDGSRHKQPDRGRRAPQSGRW